MPEGKASKGLLQTKTDAFGSNKDSFARYNGHGRSIAINKRKLQIHIGDMWLFY